MDVSVTDVNEVEKEIRFDIGIEELTPYFEKAYKEYAQKAEIKGFRKGKAPLYIIKTLFGESIEYNSLDTVASDIFKIAIDERNIKPIGEPTLTDIDYKRGQFLKFKVKYEIKPNFELKKYKGLKFEKINHIVTDKEVDDEILRLRKSQSTLHEVDSASDVEHVITADLQQIDDSGNPIIGNKDTDVRIYLANETIYPEMKIALLNTKKGDVKRVKIERNEKDQKETNNIEITVKKIEKVNIPEYDDELVIKLSKNKITNKDEFRMQLRKEIEDFWNGQSEKKLTESIISEIVRNHEFTVPESLVKNILDSYVEDLKNRYPDKKLPPDFNEEEYREKNKSYATFQARWFLIREKIIENENISVSDDDLNTLAEKESVKYNIEKERLIQFYKNSHSIKEQILTEKLMSFLKQNSKITEKQTEDYNI